MRSAVGVVVVAAATALTGASAVAGQQPSAHAVLEAAAERYEAVETLCADFVQELAVPLLDESRTGQGRMCQTQPDRFAMRFSEPPGDAVVVDGTWVWVFYPSLNEKQVIRFPIGGGSRGFDFHREFLHDPASKYEATYEGRETVGGHDTHRIRLVPRGPASYQAAVIWIDAGSPVLRRVRIEDENGTVRTVTLSAVDLDPAVDADWFTFTPPPGALIISR
jgi:outer membrane lipoprotein-sorting protein